ncbi:MULTISPECIES: hypothetical protein [unclassified Bradyrhizobium]|nr:MULTISPECIES: hypothetical protein [unclassified Bradyrhizobium]
MTPPLADPVSALHDVYAGREQNEQAIAGFRCNSGVVSDRQVLT